MDKNHNGLSTMKHKETWSTDFNTDEEVNHCGTAIRMWCGANRKSNVKYEEKYFKGANIFDEDFALPRVEVRFILMTMTNTELKF